MEKLTSVVFLLFTLCIILCREVSSNDKVKTLYTFGYYYSQYFPLEENLTPDRLIRFSVRAPRDAHILLAPTHDADEPVYEIVLGAHNNTVNHIRGRCPCQEEPSATVRTVNLLNANEFRHFWLRIKKERLKTFIQVGLGDSDTPFHEWRDPRPLQPQYLSFRSATKAEWHYGFRDSNYNSGISLDRRQSVVTSTGFGQYFPISEIASFSTAGITLYLTIRSEKEIQILLSPLVSTLGEFYLIGIHENGAYLKKRLLGVNIATYKQSKFLTKYERSRFWIELSNDGMITLGKGTSLSALLQWRDPHPITAQYLSFAMYQPTNEDYDPSVYSDVQYGLGPDYTISSQDCTPRWREAAGILPSGAVHGGRYNEHELFVCRAHYNGEAIPGNYIAEDENRGGCYIAHNFSVQEIHRFEVLTGCCLKWVSASLGHVPEGAIVGGYKNNTPKYYIVRVKHEGVLIIGGLVPEERIAHVPFKGQQLPFTNYEVLVQAIRTETSTIVTGNRKPSPFLVETGSNLESTVELSKT
ncbi:uncharacterized protein [Prorops nasuta]|uniref:uncharacterized protein isoform X2 n=1 Tax=Prorops nasuta TaxID=863751 RepID=UPI0034CFCEE0